VARGDGLLQPVPTDAASRRNVVSLICYSAWSLSSCLLASWAGQSSPRIWPARCGHRPPPSACQG